MAPNSNSRSVRTGRFAHNNSSLTLLGQRTSSELNAVNTSAHSEVRWEKILSLRTAIACGRYNISAEALAAKLMDYMRGEAAQRERHARSRAC